MAIEFNYETEEVSDVTAYDLLNWIGDLHSEMTDADLLPDPICEHCSQCSDGISTETHQQLMILSKAAETGIWESNTTKHNPKKNRTEES